MNKKIKSQWIKALRSGRYRQAHGVLGEVVDGRARYCCLGVLCQITKLVKRGRQDSVITFDDIEDVLPDAVALKCDMANNGELNTDIVYNGEICKSLAALNDNGMSFAEIADVIEDQF